MGQFEKVYTVEFYWDCPRSGIAEFVGRPHHYESAFDEAADDYGAFVLRPVNDETLRTALELWEMYVRFYRDHYPGSFPKHDVPVHPSDRDRYLSLWRAYDAAVKSTPPVTTTAKAAFRRVGGRSGPSALATFEVRWTMTSTKHGPEPGA
ncbi:MAG: hypothetical protein ABR915_06535 [Thermoguttaceae bacterium]|jgi:hypothetical protein